MKNKILVTVIAGLCACLIQCTSTKSASSSMPDASIMSVAENRWPGTTEAMITRGQMIYTNDCRNCHGDKGLTKRDEETWKNVLEEMAQKANLSISDKEAVTRYILSARESKLNK